MTERRPVLTRPRQNPVERRRVWRIPGSVRHASDDVVVREEPLEIRVRDGSSGARARRLALAMRTPGQDAELVVGLLAGEGVVRSRDDLVRVVHEPPRGEAQEFNSIRVELARGVTVPWAGLRRPLAMTSACGVCGRASIDHLRAARPLGRLRPFRVAGSTLRRLPGALAAQQSVFAETGGIHAAATFDGRGRLGIVCEDVGRHNAVDKLVGRLLLEGSALPPAAGLAVSGRAGFEILQKAVRAGFPLVASFGAPSSLAVQVADAFGLTLVGFLGRDRFNVYAGPERVR